MNSGRTPLSLWRKLEAVARKPASRSRRSQSRRGKTPNVCRSSTTRTLLPSRSTSTIETW
jgi:hypothetical protein